MNSKIRNLNPKSLHDEDVATLSLEARFMWAYLPCFADREGRLEDKPLTLKIEIFPIQNVNIDDVLTELANKKLIMRYIVSGRKYIQIRNFAKYQRPYTNEAESKIPPMVVGAEKIGAIVVKKEELSEVGKTSLDTVEPETKKSGIIEYRTSDLDTNNIEYSVEYYTDIVNQLQLSEEELSLIQTLPYGNDSWNVTQECWLAKGPWKSQDGIPEKMSYAKEEFMSMVDQTNWHEFITCLNRAVNSVSKAKKKYLGMLSNFIREERWKDYKSPTSKKTPEVDWSKEPLNLE